MDAKIIIEIEKKVAKITTVGVKCIFFSPLLSPGQRKIEQRGNEDKHLFCLFLVKKLEFCI
jgi:hypothetical protein